MNKLFLFFLHVVDEFEQPLGNFYFGVCKIHWVPFLKYTEYTFCVFYSWLAAADFFDRINSES